jgi:plastocyanin
MRGPLLVLAALALAGCGGAAETVAPVVTTEVAMVKSYRFEPGTIEIAPGSTVTWRNEDTFTHTVRVEDGEDHEVAPGRSVAIRFDEPGTFAYVCTLHRKDMDGEIVVR